MRSEKLIKTKLRSSNWKCSDEMENDVEYYELRFTSDRDVEGWIKKFGVLNPECVFRAVLVWNQNLVVVQKDEESFIAIPIGDQMIASIDDDLMVFKKVA
ncbi:MAG: hypothetical protein OXE77_04555 [Flavobacteriaceae bacterium]|nr:hypothetical protein [Flavobacteriaceae bacterium]MCY4267830.1 hypothetical protein [Flavobacteriaceae bacterium]MCY4298301.1 hypothetical protein [Flavobacteriaceae bacterium]